MSKDNRGTLTTAHVVPGDGRRGGSSVIHGEGGGPVGAAGPKAKTLCRLGKQAQEKRTVEEADLEKVQEKRVR